MARFDIAIRDAIGNLAVAVEAKKRLGTDLAWATETHAALVERDALLERVPFLIVTPDRGYLFAGAGDGGGREFDLRQALAPLFARVGTTPAHIHPAAFEALVGQWLDSVLTTATAPADLQRWLPHAGTVQVELGS